jgi:hypothetical protein
LYDFAGERDGDLFSFACIGNPCGKWDDYFGVNSGDDDSDAVRNLYGDGDRDGEQPAPDDDL